jgi:hypothetical protein
MTRVWEEIRGFDSAGEFQRFYSYIEAQVSSGLAIERTPDPSYEEGMIFGGRWFEYTETRDVWRLVPPDSPFRGLWEKVRSDAEPVG